MNEHSGIFTEKMPRRLGTFARKAFFTPWACRIRRSSTKSRAGGGWRLLSDAIFRAQSELGKMLVRAISARNHTHSAAVVSSSRKKKSSTGKTKPRKHESYAYHCGYSVCLYGLHPRHSLKSWSLKIQSHFADDLLGN